jgi:hypothetical protein
MAMTCAIFMQAIMVTSNVDKKIGVKKTSSASHDSVKRI